MTPDRAIAIALKAMAEEADPVDVLAGLGIAGLDRLCQPLDQLELAFT